MTRDLLGMPSKPQNRPDPSLSLATCRHIDPDVGESSSPQDRATFDPAGRPATMINSTLSSTRFPASDLPTASSSVEPKTGKRRSKRNRSRGERQADAAVKAARRALLLRGGVRGRTAYTTDAQFARLKEFTRLVGWTPWSMLEQLHHGAAAKEIPPLVDLIRVCAEKLGLLPAPSGDVRSVRLLTDPDATSPRSVDSTPVAVTDSAARMDLGGRSGTTVDPDALGHHGVQAGGPCGNDKPSNAQQRRGFGRRRSEGKAPAPVIAKPTRSRALAAGADTADGSNCGDRGQTTFAFLGGNAAGGHDGQ